MNSFRFSVGIILLIAAVGLYFYVEDIKDDRVGLFYYSPWISGFFGIIFLAKAGPYRGYHGSGGYGSHNRRRSLRSKTKKRLIAATAIIVVIGGGVFLYTNYDVTIADQKIDELIPVEAIEKTFNEMYDDIPLESLENTFDEISEAIPIKIEPKPETLESKLKDCSVYKKNYLDSYKNTRSTPDNMASMIGDALTGTQQTRACEAYNDKVYQEFGILGHCKLPPPSLDLSDSKGEMSMSYKERFIKYCGQDEWDYLNKK